MINLLVVDEQNLTHRLVETYLEPETEIKIVGFAYNGQEAIDKIPRLQPDVVLMDVEMPEMDGLTATKVITQEFPQIKVLILTVRDNEKHLSTALQNGAKGYLLKTTTPQELKNAICFANQGYFQLSVELTEKYLQKIITTKSETEELIEVKRKINYLYKSLNKIEVKFEQNFTGNLDEQIEPKLEEMLQREMSMLRERDSHLQFKVDRMKYSQEKLSGKIKYLFKVSIACIAIVLLTAAYAIFTSLN